MPQCRCVSFPIGFFYVCRLNFSISKVEFPAFFKKAYDRCVDWKVVHLHNVCTLCILCFVFEISVRLTEHFLLKNACCCEDNGGSLKAVYWFLISALLVLGIISWNIPLCFEWNKWGVTAKYKTFVLKFTILASGTSGILANWRHEYPNSLLLLHRAFWWFNYFHTPTYALVYILSKH
jgi:hypothetical protein